MYNIFQYSNVVAKVLLVVLMLLMVKALVSSQIDLALPVLQ